MPVNPVGAAAGTPDRDIVKELASACILQFGDIRGPGNGVGNGSCCAAVKLLAPGPFGPEFRFGQSQAHLLDAAVVGAGGLFNAANHAERVAWAQGAAAGGAHNHLFVELPPCGGVNGCAAWVAATIPLVNVWYLYPNTPAMVAAHAGGNVTQFAALNAALP